MPNWVTNRLCIITNNKFDLESICNKEDNVDFNKIVPQPLGLYDIIQDNIKRDIDIYNKYIDNTATQDEIDILLNEYVETKTLSGVKSNLRLYNAKLASTIERMYGSYDWYNWNCENWGTKWNAYNTAITENSPFFTEIEFDTAWSTPDPIIKALSVKYPNCVFEVIYADEDWGSNSGNYSYKNGDLICENTLTAEEAATKIHGTREEYYGENNEEN